MRKRRATVQRTTRETEITVALTLEGRGRARARTGIGFFDHMLEAMAMHGGFDLDLRCRGDLHVDQHHTVEDCGLVLGQAFAQALGGRRGIARAGFFLMPMDEALAMAAVDLGGRACAVAELRLRAVRIGGFETELIPDFLEGLARGAGANLHLRAVAGRSSHHKVEALFKALGRALAAACARSRGRGIIPSTKGVL